LNKNSDIVVFGSPVADDDNATRAVETAMEMQRCAKKIDEKLYKKNGLRLKIGIGISTGKVFSGILGSLRIKEFTSIGMPVNIAARLQSMAKGGEILISDATFQKFSGEIKVETLPSVTVKGVDRSIVAYKVEP
jgi:adenylate cyclase